MGSKDVFWRGNMMTTSSSSVENWSNRQEEVNKVKIENFYSQ